MFSCVSCLFCLWLSTINNFYGTHVKNKVERSLLVDVAKDANNELFTLEYIGVDADNDITGNTFFYQIKDVIASKNVKFFNSYTSFF